jgi:peptidoglycan/xylan/chitin deacetylase (PgdA/CDA1 family)
MLRNPIPISDPSPSSPRRSARPYAGRTSLPARDGNHPPTRIPQAAAVMFLVLCASCGGQPSPVPSGTPTPFRPSPTVSVTATATSTPSPTPSPTQESYAGQIPILEYHYTTYRFSDDVYMTTEWFQSQMRWLVDNGYTTITAEQLVLFLDGKNLPAKSVMLTFDSGTGKRSDFSQNIVAVLQQYGLHALFFVVTSSIGDVCKEDDKICWDDLRQWSDQGVISVESHGISHPDYSKISATEQRQDAGTSRKIITEKIGRAPVGFAYPYDAFNITAAHSIQSAGYQFALAGNTRADRSVHRSDADRYYLPRVYPYSNGKIYPAIYGASGKTFGEMIAGYSAVQIPVPATPQGTPSGTITPPPAATDLHAYLRECAAIDQMTNSQDRTYALAQLPLSPDVGADARSKLAKPVIVKPSCNVIAGNVPRGIVLHTTRGTLAATISEFQRSKNTSAHYIIDRDGQIYQMVPEGLGAFHASCGDSRSGCIASCPLCEGPDGAFLQPYLQSIGIELVNDGQLVNAATYTGLIYEDYLMSFGYRYWEDFPDAQLQSLVLLVNDIRTRRGIPLDLVVGHYRINQKTDPGPALNISWYRSGNPPRPPIFTQ